MEELKRKCTYEVLAPATAMLKPFCLEPWPLEKPFKEGLKFLKMSEERKRKGSAPPVSVTLAVKASSSATLQPFSWSTDNQ